VHAHHTDDPGRSPTATTHVERLDTSRQVLLATMARNLNLLKRAMQRVGMTAVEESRGRSYIASRVTGLSAAVTCLPNPTDADHWWHWYGDKLLAPAGDTEQAEVAATKLQELRAGAQR
jgi:hypothetical protein